MPDPDAKEPSASSDEDQLRANLPLGSLPISKAVKSQSEASAPLGTLPVTSIAKKVFGLARGVGG
jgi:hypothetical protein